MTISTTDNRVSFAGNGSTTAFATGFKFFANTDLTVILVVDSTGVATTQTITTNYTVTGAGEDSGGTVTMLVAPATGETLVIVRAQPYTQGLDLVENDEFPSNSVEETLDKTVIMAQQVLDATTRSVKLAEADTSGFDPTLPVVHTVNTALVVNAAGDGWAVGPTTSDIADAGANATAAAASETAAAASAVSASAFAPIWCGTATGTADALVLTPSLAITEYTVGKVYQFRSGASPSTGAVTINISGVGALAGEMNDAAMDASNVIVANKFYEAVYDGTALQLTRMSLHAQPYDADTAKTDVEQAWTAAQYFTPQTDDTSSSGAITFDFTGGNYIEFTLTENITSITLDGVDAGKTCKLRLKQHASAAKTVTGWPSSVVWQDDDTDPVMNTTVGKYTNIIIEGGTTEHLGFYADAG